MVVLETVPEESRGDGLTIMHAALAGVVADDPVHHDLLLVLGEPAVLAAEPALGLCGRGGHPECGDDADDPGDEAFVGEEVAPGAAAGGVFDVEEAEGEEGADDAGEGVRDPEAGEAFGELAGFVEEGQEQDCVGDESALEEAEEGA